jgi:hypothetical protein
VPFELSILGVKSKMRVIHGCGVYTEKEGIYLCEGLEATEK